MEGVEESKSSELQQKFQNVQINSNVPDKKGTQVNSDPESPDHVEAMGVFNHIFLVLEVVESDMKKLLSSNPPV